MRATMQWAPSQFTRRFHKRDYSASNSDDLRMPLFRARWISSVGLLNKPGAPSGLEGLDSASLRPMGPKIFDAPLQHRLQTVDS